MIFENILIIIIIISGIIIIILVCFEWYIVYYMYNKFSRKNMSLVHVFWILQIKLHIEIFVCNRINIRFFISLHDLCLVHSFWGHNNYVCSFNEDLTHEFFFLTQKVLNLVKTVLMRNIKFKKLITLIAEL
jgi:hypothetical protein